MKIIVLSSQQCENKDANKNFRNQMKFQILKSKLKKPISFVKQKI